MNHKERQELQEILVEYIENPRKMGGCILSIEDLFRRVHSRWVGFRHENTHVDLAETIVNRIADEHQVSIENIKSKRKSKQVIKAREEIINEMKAKGFTLAEIGRAINKHASSVIYTLNKLGVYPNG